MKNKVLHWSIVRESCFGNGTIQSTTLCGRMDNSIEDGWNIAENEEVTCKHCLNVAKQPYGQKIIEQANEYARTH